MGNRKLYAERAFIVARIDKYDDRGVWHLVGKFSTGSIKSGYDIEYRIRVAPDERWNEVGRIVFNAEKIYECESASYYSRRHTYDTGTWYISPYFDGPRSQAQAMFAFEDFTLLV